ncbi:MAG: tetratricopeptide repeat protein [Cellvibrionaceae bacterium]|nr:tetratricopeptide repeat protein [Cellvibrionaceae bacterium]
MKKRLLFLLVVTSIFVSTTAISDTKSYLELSAEENVHKGKAYVKSLYDNVEQSRALVKRHPDNIMHLSRFSEAAYRLGVFCDDLNLVKEGLQQLQRALALAAQGQDNERLAQLHSLGASLYISLYRFEQAEIALEQAKFFGASDDDLRQVSMELNWSLGRYEQAQTLIRSTAENYPSMAHVARLAILEDQLGKYDRADEYFQRAQQYDGKISPLRSAWLEVQIGLSKLEREQLQIAEAHFRTALQLLPGYTLAMEHLANTLSKQQEYAEAISLYRQLLEVSENAGFKAALAELYQQTNRVDQAEKWAQKASLAFEEALHNHPEATYQKAAAFYLAQNKPSKAIALLEKELSQRPSSEAYVALSDAQYLNRDMVAAKDAFASALRMPPVSKKLCDMAQVLAISPVTIKRLKPRCLQHLDKPQNS